MKNKIVTETYYTLRECLQIILEELQEADKTGASTIESFYSWFGHNGHLYDLTGDCLNSDSYAIVSQTKIAKLWHSFYTRYMDQYLLCVEDELNDSNLKELTSKLLELGNYFSLTVEKYAEIYNIYENQYNNLLKKVETISKAVSEVTDAPQDVTTEILENSPEYVSNLGVTADTSSTDYEPVMNKLKTIQENMKNLQKDFTNEMSVMFFESLNI